MTNMMTGVSLEFKDTKIPNCFDLLFPTSGRTFSLTAYAYLYYEQEQHAQLPGHVFF